MSSDQQIIFNVQDLHRTYGKKEVLRGITLGFYAGAKIGIIGANGSGKSTLLRIIAGEDDGYEGKKQIAKGKRVGYVRQEPQLDDTKTVRENIEVGVAIVRGMIDEYNSVAESPGGQPRACIACSIWRSISQPSAASIESCSSAIRS